MKGATPLLLLASTSGLTQSSDDQASTRYPPLPRVAATAQGFVSPGWTIVSKAQGDLNRDGRSDIVIALWTAKASRAADYDISHRWPFYRLVIAFGQANGGYRLSAESHSLIVPPAYSGGYEDALAADDLRIVDGKLDISRQQLRGHFRYRFQWLNGAFRLIGWDYAGSDGRCITDTSIDYLTRRALMTAEPIDEDAPVKKVRRSTKSRLVTLAEASAEDFYPEKLIIGTMPDC